MSDDSSEALCIEELEDIPLPSTELSSLDGGVNIVNTSDYYKGQTLIGEEVTVKKKVDAKEIILQKLMEIKEKSQQDVEECATKTQLKVKIITNLSEIKCTDLELKANSGLDQGKVHSLTPDDDQNERTSSLTKEEGLYSSTEDLYADLDVFPPSKKKRKKEKKSKKSKRKKKHKESVDPELEPGFFDVPSPKPESGFDAQSNIDLHIKKSYETFNKKHSKQKKRSRSKEIDNQHSRDQSPSYNEQSNRSRDRERHRKKSSTRSRSRSLSPHQKKYRRRSTDTYRRRSRSRSSSLSRDRKRSRDRDRYRGRSRSYSPTSKYRSSSRSRHRSRSRSNGRIKKENNSLIIDKDKLRRIALKKVAQLQTGGTSNDTNVMALPGSSLTELTDFCKAMARDSDESDGDVVNVPCTREENDLTGFIQPINKPAPIIMNIRNAKQLPIKTAEEKVKLRTSFPVSSGTHHRKEEPSEWVPVQPQEKQKPVFVAAEVNEPKEDITVLIARRLALLNKLKESPWDMQVKAELDALDQKAARWSESKIVPGAYTGVVEAKLLTPDELAPSADKRFQAWLKKDTFLRAKPVQGGIGQYLLQKMGWQAGQGLGRQNDGSLEPIVFDFNLTRKGLAAPEERARSAAETVSLSNSIRQGGAGAKVGVVGPSLILDMSDKHPVSALMEICTKRKWNPPSFDIVHESGPAHQKNFVMKVTVNGTSYQPSVSSNNKKHAKTLCAQVALQSMGLLPRDGTQILPPTTNSNQPARP